MISKICIFISLWYVFDFISFGETFDYWIDPHTGQTYQQMFVPIPVLPKNKGLIRNFRPPFIQNINQVHQPAVVDIRNIQNISDNQKFPGSYLATGQNYTQTPTNVGNKQNENKLRKSPGNFGDLIVLSDDSYLIDLEKKNHAPTKQIPRKTSKLQKSSSDSEELIVMPDSRDLINFGKKDPLSLKPNTRGMSKLQKLLSDSDEVIAIPDDPNLINFGKKNRISPKRIPRRTSKLLQSSSDSEELIIIPDDPNLINFAKKNRIPFKGIPNRTNKFQTLSSDSDELIVIPENEYLFASGKKNTPSPQTKSRGTNNFRKPSLNSAEELIVIPDDRYLTNLGKKESPASSDSVEVIVIPDDPNLIKFGKKDRIFPKHKPRKSSNLRKPSKNSMQILTIADDSHLIDVGNKERISSKSKSQPTKPSSDILQDKDFKKDSPKKISKITPIPIPILEKPLLSSKISIAGKEELQTTLKPEKSPKRKQKWSKQSKTLQLKNLTNPERHKGHHMTKIQRDHEAYLKYLKKPAKKLKFSDFLVLRRHQQKRSKAKGKSNVKFNKNSDLANIPYIRV